MSAPLRLASTSFLVALPLAACGAGEGAAPPVDRALLAAFAPLPEHMTHPELGAPAAALVELGRALYLDPRLSADGTVSCNSCHDLERAGVDGKRFSEGVGGALGDRNSPTVFHAAGHVAQFWDGRAADVEEQAKGPILNPVEMAMPSAEAVVARLREIPEYLTAFATAFPDQEEPLSFDNLAIAIGAFERGLLVPTAWDDFLRGDDDALDPAQQAGLGEFLQAGCATCHSGPYVGGAMFQKLGVVVPWPDLADEGRQKLTGKDSDRYLFKVPSLRLVSRTGPYLHDGSIGDLSEMVRLMARHQLGKSLDDDQVASIVAFLGAL